MPVTLESQNCTQVQMLVLKCIRVFKNKRLGIEDKLIQSYVKDSNNVVYEVGIPYERTNCKKPHVYNIIRLIIDARNVLVQPVCPKIFPPRE